jgi:hypothetical protein
MHFVSESLQFCHPLAFSGFSFLAGEFWPWKLHKSKDVCVSSLRIRFLCCQPDDRPTTLWLFIFSNYQLACQTPEN